MLNLTPLNCIPTKRLAPEVVNAQEVPEVIEDGLGMYVFNGWNKGMAYLPAGMYVNRGPLDVVSPNGREIITLQQVTDYDSFLLAGDASPVWCISTTEVVGVLLGK